MTTLSDTDRQSRRAFDFEVCAAMTLGCIRSLEAYSSEETFRKGRPVSTAEGMDGRAVIYRAAYAFPVLVGPGATTPEVTLKFDIGHPQYPIVRPSVFAISEAVPWSPHFMAGSGAMCIGEAWDLSGGSMLLADLLVHCARTLNWDEVDRGEGYVGWNEPAISYWRETMRRKPLHPDLAYPVLPATLLYGVTAQVAPLFRRKVSSTAVGAPVFRVSAQAKAEAPVAQETASLFRPKRGAP